MRKMYDAVTATNIPADAQMVAGYIDRIQLRPWSAADWARFPNAVKVTIVKKASTNDGHVLDVEPGDATPAEAPGWVRMRRAAGADPTVYCNTSTWPSVRAAFRSANTAEPHYWLARYDGNPAWDSGWAAAGVVAKQYAGNVAPGFDLSSVADFWPGVDGEDNDMPLTPDDIKAVVFAVWNEPFQNNLDPGWTAARDLLRFGHSEAGKFRREGGAKLDALLARASADEVAAKLLPALTAAMTSAVAGLDVSQLDKLSDEDVARIVNGTVRHAGELLGGAA